MLNENLQDVVKGIAANYQAEEIFFTDPNHHFPNKKAITRMLGDLRRVMFHVILETKLLWALIPSISLAKRLHVLKMFYVSKFTRLLCFVMAARFLKRKYVSASMK